VIFISFTIHRRIGLKMTFHLYTQELNYTLKRKLGDWRKNIIWI